MSEPEEWRSVVGHETTHEVSSYGRVRSLRRIDKKGALRLERMLKPYTNKKGYYSVDLTTNPRKSAKVHHLVLEAFICPRPTGMVARHFPDRDTANNCVGNLSWGTIKQNAEDRSVHGTEVRGVRRKLAKLDDDKVRNIRLLYAETPATQKQIADLYGVHNSVVSLVLSRKIWSHVV